MQSRPDESQLVSNPSIGKPFNYTSIFTLFYIFSCHLNSYCNHFTSNKLNLISSSLHLNAYSYHIYLLHFRRIQARINIMLFCQVCDGFCYSEKIPIYEKFSKFLVDINSEGLIKLGFFLKFSWRNYINLSILWY